jgi:hypothetical protein
MRTVNKSVSKVRINMGQQNPINGDDPVAWARAETIAYAKRKTKFYGILAIADLLVFVLVLKGMPAHPLWPYLGPISGIAFVCLIAVAGFHAIALFGEHTSRNG